MLRYFLRTVFWSLAFGFLFIAIEPANAALKASVAVSSLSVLDHRPDALFALPTFVNANFILKHATDTAATPVTVLIAPWKREIGFTTVQAGVDTGQVIGGNLVVAGNLLLLRSGDKDYYLGAVGKDGDVKLIEPYDARVQANWNWKALKWEYSLLIAQRPLTLDETLSEELAGRAMQLETGKDVPGFQEGAEANFKALVDAIKVSPIPHIAQLGTILDTRRENILPLLRILGKLGYGAKTAELLAKVAVYKDGVAGAMAPLQGLLVEIAPALGKDGGVQALFIRHLSQLTRGSGPSSASGGIFTAVLGAAQACYQYVAGGGGVPKKPPGAK